MALRAQTQRKKRETRKICLSERYRTVVCENKNNDARTRKVEFQLRPEINEIANILKGYNQSIITKNEKTPTFYCHSFTLTCNKSVQA